jgi:hypothetical protein
VLIQIVEANGTLQPMLDSGKSDRANRAIIIAASQWQGLLVFLLIVLLGRLLLGCIFPSESVKPSIQGFVAAKIPINLVLQLFNPLF